MKHSGNHDDGKPFPLVSSNIILENHVLRMKIAYHVHSRTKVKLTVSFKYEGTVHHEHAPQNQIITLQWQQPFQVSYTLSRENLKPSNGIPVKGTKKTWCTGSNNVNTCLVLATVQWKCLLSIVCLQNLTFIQLVRKLTSFCGTRKFILTFTRSCHWTASWAT